MLNIVLFGPPGAGKGTQSQKLIEKYGLIHLSTGDILRNEITRGTALGLEAKQLMDKGDLVGDDIVIGMIEAKLDENPHANGFIFDGFPRTQAQAIALDDLLQKKGTAISAMLALEVDNEELVKRLLLRGKESGRPDDQNEAIIRNRVNEYNNKTLPLKKYYSEQTKFHSINGIGSVNGIFELLVNRIIFINAEIELTNLENDIEHLDLTINDFEVATELSDELKKDLEELKKLEAKIKPVTKPAAKILPKKTVKKVLPQKNAIVKKSIAKKVVKPVAKKIVSKKMIVKKATPKKIIKPLVKKAIIKKAIAKKVKAVVKKVIAKKIVKPTAKKNSKAVAKKIVSKKNTKKVMPQKKVAAKKTSKPAPKKAIIKKAVAKKTAPKKQIKVAIKKAAPKKKNKK